MTDLSKGARLFTIQDLTPHDVTPHDGFRRDWNARFVHNPDCRGVERRTAPGVSRALARGDEWNVFAPASLMHTAS